MWARRRRRPATTDPSGEEVEAVKAAEPAASRRLPLRWGLIVALSLGAALQTALTGSSLEAAMIFLAVTSALNALIE
jgi:hypothetical protein